MKIALICRNFDKNSGQGIYKSAEYLYESLKKYSNHQITKIENGKNSYFFDLFTSPKKVLGSNFDIYHFLMPEVSLPILLSKKIRKKSVVTIHDAIVYKLKERKWLSEKYIKFMYKIAKTARLIITPSESSKKDLIKIVKIPKEKIFVIPWGVDTNKFKPIKKKKHSKFVIGYLGGLGKRKNVEILLKVAKKLENENIVFKIAGSGPEKNRLEMIAKKLKLNNVKFVGFVSEDKLNNFYNSLDLFIFPSLYEGFGLSVLEAMACGIPVITSNVSSLVEIVNDAGILVDPKSVDQIVNAVKNVLNNKKFRLKLRRKSLEQAKKFTWEKTAEKMLEVYERLKNEF